MSADSIIITSDKLPDDSSNTDYHFQQETVRPIWPKDKQHPDFTFAL